ncbi:MAG: hypothetical protein JSW04_04410 [Desulfobacterales bacterium]|nr:MAG: hypothetical protein JSW04_04410 [Desulfobacterales bacterium]
MEHEEEKSQTDIDWENRILCIDESCIGVIGPDGRCKECGKPFDSEHKEDIPPAHDIDESANEIDPSEDDESELSADIDWENRTLCIDESCIGVIGPDGKCKECGKPFRDL